MCVCVCVTVCVHCNWGWCVLWAWNLLRQQASYSKWTLLWCMHLRWMENVGHLVAQWIEYLTSAQVMISQFMNLRTTLGWMLSV